MSKPRDDQTTQHNYDTAHYGELPWNAMPSGSNVLTLGWVVDGGDDPIVAGTKGSMPFYIDCQITSVELFADVSGSFVLDIYKDIRNNYPPNSGDSITASAPPTLTNAIRYQDTTLTGWTVDINRGDVLQFLVVSSSTVKQVTCALELTRG